MDFGDVFSMLLSIVAIAAVLYGSYRFSKYMTSKVNGISSSSNVKIIERALLGQDKGLAVIEVCSKYYLIGFSNSNIEILKELEDYTPSIPATPDFMTTFKSSIKKFGQGNQPGEKK